MKFFAEKLKESAYRIYCFLGGKPLHRAVKEGNKQMVAYLTSFKWLDTHAKNTQGETPLYLAVTFNHHEIVTQILQRENLLHLTQEYGKLLLLAAEKNQFEIVKILLEHIVNIHPTSQRAKLLNQLLLIGVQKNHVEMVKLALEGGANANYKEEYSYDVETKPLEYVYQSRTLQFYDRTNYFGSNQLDRRNIEIIKQTEVVKQKEVVKPLLYKALETKCCPEIIRLLYRYGADPLACYTVTSHDYVENIHVVRLKTNAIEYASEFRAPLVKLLTAIKLDQDINNVSQVLAQIVRLKENHSWQYKVQPEKGIGDLAQEILTTILSYTKTPLLPYQDAYNILESAINSQRNIKQEARSR